MKKMYSLAVALVLLFSVLAIPAYAMDKTSTRDNMKTHQSNDGISNDYKTNNVKNNNMDGYGNSYRTTAVNDNDRGTNWSWLGLLGLLGLAGLRSRQRERS